MQTRVIGTVTPVLKGVTKRDTPKINITAEGFLSEENYYLTIAYRMNKGERTPCRPKTLILQANLAFQYDCN